MPYIQLSALPLPDEAPRTTVFPFLFKEPSGEHNRYYFSLLVSDRNPMAQAFLKVLGFKEDRGTKLPDDVGIGTEWKFFRDGISDPIDPQADVNKGPFDALTDKTGADTAHALKTYLEIIFLEDDDENIITLGDTGDIIQPKTINVKKSMLDQETFNENSELNLASIDYTHDALKQKLQFSESDNVDHTAVSFQLTASGSVPLVNIISSSMEFNFICQLEDIPDTTQWQGTVLRINEFDLVGGADDRLPLGGAAIVTHQGKVSYEWEPSAKWSIPIGPGELARVNFAAQALRIRFTEKNIGVYLYNSPTGAAIKLRVELEFPLIMKALDKTASNALPLLIPLIDSVEENIPSFKWLITFDVGGNNQDQSKEWDHDTQAIFRITEQGKWDFGTDFLNNDWPINFKNRSNNMSLGGMQFSIADLIGQGMDGDGVGFNLIPSNLETIFLKSGIVVVPVQLQTIIAGQAFHVELSIKVNLKTFRLDNNRIEFRFPVAPPGESIQFIDLGVFAILIPYRDVQEEGKLDGYIDFQKREFALVGGSHVHAPWLVIPGNINRSPRDHLIDDDSNAEPSSYKNRLIFELQPDFNPDTWPEKVSNTGSTENCNLYLRINGQGVSLNAKILTTHEPVIMDDPSATQPVKARFNAERKGLHSEIVVIDNAIRAAAMFGTLDVPGTDDLVADVEIGIRQDERGKPPTIYAEFDLEKMNGAAIAQFSVGYLQMAIEDMRLAMSWNLGNNDWDLAVIVDGAISLAPKLSSTGGLDALKKPNAMIVRDLDLLQLNKGTGNISLRLDQPVRFDCLEGMFAVTLTDLDFGWQKEKDNKEEFFFLTCSSADFQFKQAGEFDVTIEVGGVHLEFTGGNKLKMLTPSGFGIDAIIGDAVRFRGEVRWVDNEKERYFAAGGVLSIEGLPEAGTLLKIGSGIKDNGQVVPNIVLYGSVDKEVQLFSGVVAKSFGAGIGINNRLSGIGDRPNAKEMIQKINEIDPSRLDGWQFVRKNGFYLSIVGTTIIASNPGGNSTQNAYVASLVLSIDSDLNIAAAGKFWLASSVDFVRIPSNWNRPALVGAIVMLPRDQTLSAVIESRPNPAIESNKQLAKMLDKGHLTLSLLLSPDVADFHLEELSYSDNFLGIQMLFQGSFRIAMFRSAVLARADFAITGHYSNNFRGGPGGFSVRGDLALYVEYGGLLSQHGLMAYGMLDFSVSFSVRAYIRIRYPKSISWKGIKYGEKRINSGEQKLDIGMYGAVAFNESAEFGFDGSFTISTSVLGHRLSISVALAINDQVITEVRNEVATFEEALESYKQQLLDPPSTAQSLSAAAVATEPTRFSADTNSSSEQWRLYSFDGFYVPIPAQEGQWLTPYLDDQPVDPVTGEAHFISQLSKIELLSSDGVIIQTLLMPWAREHWSRINEVTDDLQQQQQELNRLEEMETLLVETAVEYKQMKDECEHRKAGCCEHYSVVSDPRVEGNVREYLTEEDQARLPDDVLPFNFRSLDDLLGSNRRPKGFDSDFERLVEYIYYRRQATRTERHRGRDLDEFEEVAQQRSVMLSMLHEALRSGDEGHFFRCLPLDSTGKEAHQCLGSIFRFEDDNNQVKKLPDGLKIRLYRGNTCSLPLDDRKALQANDWLLIEEDDQSEVVQFAVKPKWMGAFDWLEGNTVPLTQPLRKTFGSSTTVRQLIVGEVIASLAEKTKANDTAINITEGAELAKNNWYLIDNGKQSEIIQLAEDGSPGSTIIPVTDPLRFDHAVDISLKVATVMDTEFQLRRPINVQIKTSIAAPESLSIQEQLRLLPPRQQYVVDSEATGRGRIVVKLPVKFTDQLLQKQLPSLGHFQVLRRLPGESEAVLVGDYLQPNLTYLETGEFNEQRVVLVNPYLFTDEFTVSGGRLQMLDRFVPEQMEIEYWLKMISPGETSSNTSLPWAALRLHVPKPDPFPSALSMVFEAQALFLDDRVNNSTWGQFQLASTEGEAPKLATHSIDEGAKKVPFSADDFELWAEKIELEQNGFYSGGSARRSTSTDTSSDQKAIDPRKLRPQKRFHALEGKFRIKVDNAGELGAGVFKMELTDQFETGFAYRFYARSSLPASRKSLIPVASYVTRLCPKVIHVMHNQCLTSDWVEPPRLRVMTEIEMIPAEVVKQIVSGEVAALHKADFSVTVRLPDNFTAQDPITIRHRLGIAWDDVDSLDGGVEIQITDRDDSALQYRQLCEVSDGEYFRNRLKQFSNPSLWILTSAERQRRIGISDSPAPVYDGVLISPESDTLNKRFLIDNKSNPLLLNLKRRAGELNSEIDLLQNNDSDWHWIHFLTAANNWLIAVRQYLSSPLNINDQPIRNSVKQMNALITYLLLGRKVGNVALSIETIDKINQEIMQQLKLVDSAESNTIEFGVEEQDQARVAYMDIHLAEQCAAIIRRRQACAAEIFNSDDDQIPSFKQRFQARDRLLPRGEKYFKLSEKLKAFKKSNPDAQLPLTEDFFTHFPVDKKSDQLIENATKLSNSIDGFIKLTKFIDPKRKRKAASIVRKAAGLTTATNRISHLAEQQGFRLIRRPHHQLSVGTDKDGEKFAESINVAMFLPSGIQTDEINANTQVSAAPESAVIHFFNLLERLGFAVDCAFADSLNQSLSQQRMLDFIDQARLPQLLASIPDEAYQIVLLSGREPDSEYKGTMPDAEDGRSTPYGFLGFSFFKLAVIPQSFLDLVTTQFDPEPNSKQQKNIAEWFKIRSIVATEQSQLAQVNQMARRVMQPLLFSIDHQYQDELNRGAVRQGLRRVFASNAVHFSDDVLVSVPKGATAFWELKDRVSNTIYQIKLEQDKFVVLVGNESIDITTVFNGSLGAVTKELRTVFASNNTQLSDESLISVPNGAAKLWKLENRVDNKSYVIKPDKEQFKVSSDDDAGSFIIDNQFIGLLSQEKALTEADSLWQKIDKLTRDVGINLPTPINIKRFGSQKKAWDLFSKVENFSLIVRLVDSRLLIHHQKIRRIRVENRGERWVSVPSIGQRVHTSWTLPSQMGHRCQVVLRRVSRYEPFVRWAVGQYQAFNNPTDQTHQIEVKRIISNASSQDIPAQLPVSVYRHPSKIQFSYMLPSAGMRSLYNGISAVRTGYKGCELTWDYELIDHDIPELQFIPILNAMKPLSDEDALKDLKARQEQRPQIEMIPRNIQQSIRLFRHERLVTLDDLPFFYRYRLVVRSQYDAKLLVPTLPSTNTPETQRLASHMAFKPPGRVDDVILDDNQRQYTVTLDLSRLGEHLTPQEQLAAPPPLGKDQGDDKISVDYLPDPAMGYHLYYKVAGEGKEAVYILLAELLMPWHAGYEAIDGDIRPMFRSLHSEIEINDPRPQIEFGKIKNVRNDIYIYQVTLVFSVVISGQTELFKNKDQRFIQASREGFLSKPLPLDFYLEPTS